MRRSRIAVVHPLLGKGGSESCALWAIEALKQSYEITLVTTGTVDLPGLNAYYGTHLLPENITILRAPLPPPLHHTTRFAALRGSLLQRFCQTISGQFDLMLSTYGPMDFGVPGVQLIADFSFDDELRQESEGPMQGVRRFIYGTNLLRTGYLRICSTISPNGPDHWRNNLTVANSEWSQRMMTQHYGVESRIVYPPVSNKFSGLDFCKRTNGFVCLGRVAPEKRIEFSIEILAGVRQRGHDIHLHILGGGNDAGYNMILANLQEQNSEWISFEGWVSGDLKASMLTSHRFGISSRPHEAFGIAVSEMVNAGCIVFVPNGGGQVEIVNHPSLTYQDEDDAVAKICRVLDDSSLQADLVYHLSQGADRFSAKAFQQGILEVVAECLR